MWSHVRSLDACEGSPSVPGVPPAFKVSAADGARLLCLHTPGCCQAFYWDASEPAADDESRDVDAGPVDGALASMFFCAIRVRSSAPADNR